MAWLFSQFLCLASTSWLKLISTCLLADRSQINATFLLLIWGSPRFSKNVLFFQLAYIYSNSFDSTLCFYSFSQEIFNRQDSSSKRTTSPWKTGPGHPGTIPNCKVRCIFRTLPLLRSNWVNVNPGHVSRPHLGSATAKAPCIDTCHGLDLKNSCGARYGDKGL